MMVLLEVFEGTEYSNNIKWIKQFFETDVNYNDAYNYIIEINNLYLKKNYNKIASKFSRYIKLKTINDIDNINDFTFDRIKYELYDKFNILEYHHGLLFANYRSKVKSPLTIKGKFTISNTKYCNNINSCFPFPFTEFVSYDNKYIFNNIFIKPKQIIYNNNTYNNILHEGILGEVIFDAEMVVSKDSFIKFDGFVEYDYATILVVKEIKLNKIIATKKYDECVYIEQDAVKYDLSSDDEYVNIRKKPNGEIIKKLYLNKYSGNIYALASTLDNLFNNGYEYNGYEYGEEIQLGGAYNKLFNLETNNTHNINWYKVIYFPDESKYSNPVIGYIHSSQLTKIQEND